MLLEGEPVEVTVEIKVVSFGELNEANMVWLCFGLFLLFCVRLFFFSHCVRHSIISTGDFRHFRSVDLLVIR